MYICVFGAASDLIDNEYKVKTEEFCKTLAKRGHNLIYGAGATGLMGAAARGFKKGKGKVTGVAPNFFTHEVIEPLYNCDNMIYTDNMATRKAIMEENAEAFVITPGGVGTFDEFFQVLTLKDLGRHNKPIAVYNIKGYYYSIQALMHNGEEEHFLRNTCQSLYRCFDVGEEEEMIAYLESQTEEKRKVDREYS